MAVFIHFERKAHTLYEIANNICETIVSAGLLKQQQTLNEWMRLEI